MNILLNKKKIIGLLFLILLVPAAVSCAEKDLLQYASDYLKKGRYLEALSFYNDIEMNMDKWQDQETASYYKGLGDLYLNYLGDEKNAISVYLKLIERFPDAPEICSAYHNAAKAFLRLGKKEKAKRFYHYLELNFSDYFKNNKIEKELKDYERGEGLVDDISFSSERLFPSKIRVLVLQSKSPVSFYSEDDFDLFHDNGSLIKGVAPGTDTVFSAMDGSLLLDGLNAGMCVRLRSDDGQDIRVNDRSYRGDIRVSAEGEQVSVVNHIGLEEYLYGVIPKEVSPSWPEQSLMTQAVAARTYALYHMLKREHESYDVFSTTSSQVYGGRESEHPAARKAVDLTGGEVLINNGRIVLALYHANSGGRTEQMEDVWHGGLPYLTSVEDKFSKNRPGYSWDKKLEKVLIEKGFEKFGLDISSVTDIVPVERSGSGRIKKLKVYQGDEYFFLSGNSFRLMVGPAAVKSSNFTVKKEKERFLFLGTGYGHGVGMSQWGANSMAKKSYDYRQILKFYYPGAEIVKIKTAQQIKNKKGGRQF